MIDNIAPDLAETQTIADPSSPSFGPVFRSALQGALLGVMIALGLLALSRVMLVEGGMSFAGWAGRVVHDGVLQKPGLMMMDAAYGEDEALNVRGDIRTLYILLGTALLGLPVGILAGLAAGLLRRKFGRRAASPCLPWSFPLGLALLGVFYHGFVWSNVAVMLLPHSRRRTAVTVATWAIAFLAVLGWAWAMEIDWPEGWSKIYPWSRSVFFFLGYAVGAKEG